MENEEEKQNAKTLLETKMKEIKKEKPKATKACKAIGSVITLVPSNDKDLKKIKYYNPKNITKPVKDNFRKHFEFKKIEFNESPSFHTPSNMDVVVLGSEWGTLLSQKIEGVTNGEEANENVANAMLEQLKENFGIDLFVSNMPLYGYMYSEKELSPQVYYWDGEADAVGWYYNEKRKKHEYVIVDWKVLDLLNYWESSSAYGKHLHQCLVYGKLLQLHLNLDYLPSILIVPIHAKSGLDVYPGLFSDYPDECKSVLNEQLVWSIELPKPPRNIYAKSPFNPELPEGVVDKKMLLKDLFADGAKVKHLLKAFDLNGLKVITE